MNRHHTHQSFWVTIFFLALAFASVGHGVVQAQTAPVISQLVPSTKAAGGNAFTLTVICESLPAGAQVFWNGQARTTRLFGTGTGILEADILASDIATAAIIPVTVAAPGGTPSNVLNFTVTTTNPAPVLTGISPSRALVGSAALTLSVSGQGFTAQSVVLWNGSSRTTTFVDSERLTAQITAEDLAETGENEVAVRDTAPGGGTSGVKIFTVSESLGIFFPHFAIDAGYTTILTLVNSGNVGSEAKLTFTASGGGPQIVKGMRDSIDLGNSSVFNVAVPAKGVRVLTFSSPEIGQSPKAGWLQVDTSTEFVTGVLTFKKFEGPLLTAFAGVLPAAEINSAAIPVDNVSIANRQLGFAIANPGAHDINITVTVIGEDGNTVALIHPPELNPLPARRQVPEFLWQILPAAKDFRGTMVLTTTDPGDTFVAVALAFDQQLMTVLPVIRQ